MTCRFWSLKNVGFENFSHGVMVMIAAGDDIAKRADIFVDIGYANTKPGCFNHGSVIEMVANADGFSHVDAENLGKLAQTRAFIDAFRIEFYIAVGRKGDFTLNNSPKTENGRKHLY